MPAERPPRHIPQGRSERPFGATVNAPDQPLAMSTKHNAVGYQDGNLVARLATKLVSKILAPPAKPDYIARLDARWRAAMAHNLKLGIIAEGVETEAQARFLLEERCEEAQGFLYAKPLSAADFEAYLRERRLALHVAHSQPKQSYYAVTLLPRPNARTNRRGPGA
jgi:hypothetical protein